MPINYLYEAEQRLPYTTEFIARTNRYYKYAKRTATIYSAYRTMGYLRGSNKIVPISRPFARYPSYDVRMQTQINELRRKVNKQKPEVKHWFATWSHTATGGTTVRSDYDLTSNLHSDPTFRDNVLGDKWRNIKLHVKLVSNGNNVGGPVRFIVYRPNVPGTVWPGTGINQHLNPNDHWVLYDQYITPEPGSYNNATAVVQTNKRVCKSFRVNLRELLTTFDTAVRKNNIKLAILTEDDSNGSSIINMQLMLEYSNV